LILVAIGILFYPYLKPTAVNTDTTPLLKVLTYSSFIKPWGPGPELAEVFKKKTGMGIRWIDGGNAGLIMERLRFKNELDRSDVVLGFDQFFLMEARKTMKWRDVGDVYSEISENLLPEGSIFRDFFAFDWGALTFVYREGEVDPPNNLRDLLNPRFKKKIILQDPRMSSPGLQFLFWSLQVFGGERAMDYLHNLKPSIQVLAPSWSSSYSLFQVKPGTLVFSYFTSPYYHLKNEDRDDYKAAVFSDPHPVQVEYAGIPETCEHCKSAKAFLKFLAGPEAQKILMEKNYMFPANAKVLREANLKLPDGADYASPMESWSLIRERKQWIDRWKKLFY